MTDPLVLQIFVCVVSAAVVLAALFLAVSIRVVDGWWSAHALLALAATVLGVFWIGSTALNVIMQLEKLK